MRILLDTNILISAALFPNGTAAKAYVKAVTYPNKGIRNTDLTVFSRKTSRFCGFGAA